MSMTRQLGPALVALSLVLGAGGVTVHSQGEPEEATSPGAAPAGAPAAGLVEAVVVQALVSGAAAVAEPAAAARAESPRESPAAPASACREIVPTHRRMQGRVPSSASGAAALTLNTRGYNYLRPGEAVPAAPAR